MMLERPDNKGFPCGLSDINSACLKAFRRPVEAFQGVAGRAMA
jgi:hypothetical protein